MPDTAYARLPLRKKIFVDAYLQVWEATEAARMAGYPDTTARGKAYKWLRDPRIELAIQERLRASVLNDQEVLSRLSQQATVNMGMFFIFEDLPVMDPVTNAPIVDANGNPVMRQELIGVDWRAFQKYGHLIKKLSWRDGRPVLELHDNQAALVHIGKHLRLFAEVNENTNLNVDVTSDDLAKARDRARQIEHELLGQAGQEDV